MTKSSAHKPVKTTVYYKIFPLMNMRSKNVKILNDHKTFYVRYLQELGKKASDGEAPKYWKFKTNGIFYNNPLKDIYSEIVPGILESCLEKNAIIIAFGQTGSGKSSSITGLQYSFEDRGFLPRLIEDIFQISFTLLNNVKMCIKISYIELNKTKATDLLKSLPNSFDNLSVQNIIPVKVRNQNEALKYLYLGEGRKELSKSSTYPSHTASSIFTFYLITKSADTAISLPLTRKLHVIDLAGADNSGNLSCSFKKPHEIGIGNLAKSDLEQFLLIMSENNSKRVQLKRRQNIMLNYLGDSLNNNSVLSFIGHLRITDQDLQITLSMLRFGQLVRSLKPTNIKPLSEKTNKEKQKNENKLQEYNIIFQQSEISLKPTQILDQNRITQMEQISKDYIENKFTENELLNLADVNIILKTLKDSYLELKTEMECTTKRTYEQAYADAYMTIAKSKKSTISSSVMTLAGSKFLVIPEKSEENTAKAGKKSLVKMSKNKIESLKVGRISKSSENRGSLISVGHRKSSHHSTISDMILMPQMIPEYKSAWKVFIEDKNTRYKEILDKYKNNEKESKNAYKSYLDDVNKLRKTLDLFEKKKNDLLQIQINQKLLNVTAVEEKNSANVSDAEERWKRILKELEIRIANQQEQLLKQRTELNIYLKLCKDIKSEIKNSFDQYCLKNFNVLLAVDSSSVLNNEINEQVLRLSNPSSEDINNNKKVKTDEQVYFANLKKLLVKEQNRKANMKKKWVKY